MLSAPSASSVHRNAGSYQLPLVVTNRFSRRYCKGVFLSPRRAALRQVWSFSRRMAKGRPSPRWPRMILSRGFRIRRRQRRKAGKACWILLDRLVKAIVGIARHGDRDLGAEGLRARRAEGQHLHVDARGVHVRQALGAEVGVLLDDVVAE